MPHHSATRVIALWIAAMLVGAAVSAINPLDRIEIGQVILRSSSVLAMLVCIELWRIETKEGRAITTNMMIVFACTGILLFLTETDSIMIFTNSAFAGFYANQYGNAIYNLSLLFFCVFLLVNFLAKARSLHKYIIAGTVSIVIGLLFYYPIIENPQYAYTVPEVSNFKLIEEVRKEIEEVGTPGGKVDAEAIARQIDLTKWKEAEVIRSLTEEELINRIRRILPYTDGLNYVNLINAPLRTIGLRMNLVAISFLVILIVVHFKRDPPTGAYIDKLAMAFLLYLVFEAVHGYIIQDIVDWKVFLKIDGIGKIVTSLLVLLLTFVELRRYRFLSGAYGKYYESLLMNDPQRITRWRDGLDNIILDHFFKPRRFLRRFFQSSNRPRNNSEKFRKNT